MGNQNSRLREVNTCQGIDNYFTTPTGNSTIDFLVSTEFFNNTAVCFTDPCSNINSTQPQYKCENPNYYEPGLQSGQIIGCQQYGGSPGDSLDAKCNKINPPCAFREVPCGSDPDCDPDTIYPGCYFIPSACVPKEPPANIKNINDPNLLNTMADCCLNGNTFSPPPSDAPKGPNGYINYKCGKGLCPLGNNCHIVFDKLCSSDPNSIFKNASCRKYMQQNFDPETNTNDIQVKKKLLDNFIKANITDYQGDPAQNPLNNVILSYCTDPIITGNNPDACYTALDDYCKTKLKTSYEDLTKNITDEVTQLCGCFLEPSKYPFPLSNSNCQPICVASPFNNPKQPCTTNTCYLDVNIANTIITKTGQLDITGVCQSAKDQKNQTNKTTICDLTIDAYNNLVSSNNTSVKGNCGSCNLVDNRGNFIQVIPCPIPGGQKITGCRSTSDCSFNFICDPKENICVPSVTPVPGPETYPWWVYLLIGLGILLLIGLITGGIYLFRSRKRSKPQ
jgi:hypothetical protein